VPEITAWSGRINSERWPFGSWLCSFEVCRLIATELKAVRNLILNGQEKLAPAIMMCRRGGASVAKREEMLRKSPLYSESMLRLFVQRIVAVSTN
jgi:hypothetical protein